MLWVGFTSDGDALDEVEAEDEEAAKAALASGEHAGQFVYAVEKDRFDERYARMEEEYTRREDALCRHEAAHAVIALSQDLGIRRVSMKPRPFYSDGRKDTQSTHFSVAMTFVERDSRHPHWFVNTRASLIMAGWAAERKLDGKPDWERFWNEGGSDAIEAKSTALLICGYPMNQKCKDGMFDWAAGFTDGIVNDHWRGIQEVAGCLKHNRETTGEQFEGIIRDMRFTYARYPNLKDLVAALNRLKQARDKRLKGLD